MSDVNAKAITLSCVCEPFRGTCLEEFVAHFGLFPLKPVFANLDITTLDILLEVLSSQTSMAKIEEQVSDSDMESLLNAVRLTDFKWGMSEKPIPYRLRSGNKNRSGKRKKQQDNADESSEVTDMRKKKVNIRALHNQLKKAASLDLAILLDCTASMGSYLRDIQSHITTLVTAVGELHPDSSLRLAFVGYHHVQNDFADTKQYIQRFTKDVSAFSTVLNGLHATGGGFDGLADVAGALKIASELDWQSTTRIVFHIGDMPCHGNMYHSALLCDMYPAGDPNGIVVEDKLTAVHNAGVEYFFGRLTAHTDQMIRVFNQHFKSLSHLPSAAMASLTQSDQMKASAGRKNDDDVLSDGYNDDTEANDGDDEKEDVERNDEDYDKDEDDDSFDGGWDECRDDRAEEEYIKQIDIQDPSFLLSTITAKVTESMTASLTTSFSTHATLGELLTQFGSLNIKPPKWKLLSSEPGTLHEIPLPESMDELMLEPYVLLGTRHAAFEPTTDSSPSSPPLHEGNDEDRTRRNFDTSLGLVSLSTVAEETGYQIKLGDEPFARGACRNAYRARVTSNPPRSFRSRLRSGHLSAGPRLVDLTGIVKLPLQSSRQQDVTLGGYSAALNLQHSYVVAQYLAGMFNSRVRLAVSGRGNYSAGLHFPTIMYNTVTLLHLPSRVGSQQFATVEHDISIPRPTSELFALQSSTFAESVQLAKSHSARCATRSADPSKSSNRTKLRFEKFNGNHGLCVPNPSPHGTDHAIVQAFSHWSYEETGHALVVVDCQGVFHPGNEDSDGAFLLTDPAIHSTNVLKFGGTNLGEEGMKRFFQTHRCNAYCALLELPRGVV